MKAPPPNKIHVSKDQERKIRKLFFQQKIMEDITVLVGLTERVIRRVINENNWIIKRERYLRFLANYGYLHDIPLCRLAEKTGVLIYALCRVKRKYKIPDAKFEIWNKRLNKKTEVKFVEMYASGKTADFIAESFGFKTGKTVYDVLEKYGVQRRDPKIQTHYNEDFFEKIDSHEKAYILGLILTDGYILKDYIGFGIQLTKEDGYILEKIAALLGPSSSVTRINCDVKRKTLPNCKDMVRFTVHNRKIAEDLKKLGVIRNKSKILRYNGCVPDEYLSSFFRGLIDGDGCIWTNGKRMQVQIASASKRFIEDLKALKPGCFSIQFSSTKNKKTNKICNMYILYVKGGWPAVVDFLEWIYKNKNDLYLRRKYGKIQNQIG